MKKESTLVVEKRLNKSDEEFTQEEIRKAIQDYLLDEAHLHKPLNSKEFPPIFKDSKHELSFSMFTIKEKPTNQSEDINPKLFMSIYHPIDVEITDALGGKFSCRYDIAEALDSMTDFLRTLYPPVPKKFIENYAKEKGLSYNDARTKYLEKFSKILFKGRVKIGKFFHKELRETLELVIHDLIIDAQLYAMSLINAEISKASDFTLINSTEYIKQRRNRIKLIKTKGRPLGSSPKDEIEFERTIKDIDTVIQELEKKGQKITKNALSRNLYKNHSNPILKLSRFFKKYNLTFEQVLNEYRSEN